LRLYASRLQQVLEKTGYTVIKFVFCHGEASKNAATYIQLLHFLAKNHLVRTDAVFALGGGVVGDMAGFAAATYLRGVRFVQLPTTLLAAVDSSVGGKTAIDLEGGKNLAGAFYQPDLVLCDCSLLETLEPRHISDGLAEVIKYAVVRDEGLFTRLKTVAKKEWAPIIARCVEIKGEIVGKDAMDTGVRELLNFGHTFGHAIEASGRYTLSHGSAVGIGMAIITRACVKQGRCDLSCQRELEDMLTRHGLSTQTDLSEEVIFQAVLSDKKRKQDGITLILPRKIGLCEGVKVSLEEAKEYLHLGL
ncbi:MAG TPA: 3-dehydroquinate synthase, partial [Clostridiales bacterium]|nr:3-dehydroquinate synthase [Clostridiales bacterium]